jgi:micrococcal nuclease
MLNHIIVRNSSARQARPTPLLRATLAAALAVTLTSCLHMTARAGTPQCNLDNGEERTVTRVIDGETMVVDGGSEVRLAGALAPQALDRLVTGKTVTLAFAGRRTDRYGRLLAHAFAAEPGDAGKARPRVWVQGEMLRQGLARAYALEATAQCLAELISHEAVARQAGAGMWTEAAYAIRHATEVAPLLRVTGTYQIVEGRVRATGDVRGTMYLNFGEDYRQDFTVVIRPAARRALTTAGAAPDALDGAVVRVRGWIERRGGPLIEVLHHGMIEVIEPKPAATAGEPHTKDPASPRRSRRRPDPR